jgi:hypothetical protein
VAPGDSERCGVLVLRVWVEDHPDHPLRAIITRWSEHGADGSQAVASVEEATSIVETWLRSLLDQ